MSAFILPSGYSFETDEEKRGTRILSDIPAMTEYGGATVTQAWDALGVHFVAMCCKNPMGIFAFRVFREDAPENWREIILPDFCDGRGSIATHPFDGSMRYIAWKGNQFFSNIVPEAVPIPRGGTSPSVAHELAVLLWGLDYVSDAEVLGPPGLYVRLNKIMRALRQLQQKAREAGWLT